MSEYQFVYFGAVDRPLDDEALEYMQQQSTRAEITRWEFRSEYHYGDFRGNSAEMLRRGFDVHLHFANFGMRKLMFRLPFEFPGGVKSMKPYTAKREIVWHKDKSGEGGVLEFCPYHEIEDYGDDPDCENVIGEIGARRQG
jgi:hypothetical protein